MVLAAAADASWTLAPGPLALMGLGSYAYTKRWLTIRADPATRSAEGWRLACWYGAMAAVLIALVSPVDRLAEQLFAMHMTQHVLLLDVAPIFAMLALTKTLLRPVTRRTQRVERAAGPLAHPAFAVALYVLTMYFWHIPAMYDAALELPVVHVLEHLSFAAAGGLYWWHLLSPIRGRISVGPFGPVVYMLVTKLVVGGLGIGLTFAPRALYDFYESAPRVWGLSALDDQSAAGAIMAVEQSLVMGLALAYLFVKALGEAEQADEREERYSAS